MEPDTVDAEYAPLPDWEKPCARCTAEGQTSTVEYQRTASTEMDVDYFRDSRGNFHEHNPNRVICVYRCSRGHGWTEQSIEPCWACAWPNLHETQDPHARIADPREVPALPLARPVGPPAWDRR